MKEKITWFLDIKEKTIYDDNGNEIAKYWWNGEWIKYEEPTPEQKEENNQYLTETFGL